MNPNYWKNINPAMLAPKFNQLVAALAHKFQIPVAGAIHAALTPVVMAANLHRGVVTHDGKRMQPLVLFLLEVARSGVGKSPPIDLVLQPLRDHDSRAIERQRDSRAEWESWVTRVQRVKRAAGKSEEAAEELRILELARPTLVTPQPIVVEGATFGYIVDHLVMGGPTLLLSDEINGLKRSGLMQYGKLAPLYSGNPVSDNTRTNGTSIALRPRSIISVLLPLGELYRWLDETKESLRSSGALPRFVMMYAPAIFGWRDFTLDTSAADAIIEKFRRWLSRQIEMFVADPSEYVHRFDSDAWATYEKWDKSLEDRQRPGETLAGFHDCAAKARDQVVRMAACIEWFETGSLTISNSALVMAIALIELSLECYDQVLGPELDSPMATTWAPRTLGWLKGQLPNNWFSKSLSVLREECPRPVCPRKLWNSVVDQLADEKMIVVRKRTLALTPNAYGLMSFDMPFLKQELAQPAKVNK